jgi:hypothetical protein
LAGHFSSGGSAAPVLDDLDVLAAREMPVERDRHVERVQ